MEGCELVEGCGLSMDDAHMRILAKHFDLHPHVSLPSQNLITFNHEDSFEVLFSNNDFHRWNMGEFGIKETVR